LPGASGINESERLSQNDRLGGGGGKCAVLPKQGVERDKALVAQNMCNGHDRIEQRHVDLRHEF